MPISNEALEKRQEDKTREYNEGIEAFIEKIKGSNVKYYDLKKSKDELFLEFVEDFKQIKTANKLSDIAMKIFKSYYLISDDSKRKELYQYIDVKNFRLNDVEHWNRNIGTGKTGSDLIKNFISDFVLFDEEKKYLDEFVSQKYSETKKCIEKVLVLKLKHIFGSYLYYDLSKVAKSELPENNTLRNYFNEFGYIEILDNIFVNKERVTADLNYQKFIQKTFVDFSSYAKKSFLDNVANKKTKISKAKFEAIYHALKGINDTLNDLLCDEFKKSSAYLTTSKNLEFLNGSYDAMVDNYTYEGSVGETYLKIKETLETSSESSEVIKQFSQLCQRINKVLSIKDDKFKDSFCFPFRNYPINYFVVTDIHPKNLVELIELYNQKFPENKLDDSLIVKSFEKVPHGIEYNSGRQMDVANCLRTKGKELVYTSQELQNVQDYIQKHNLPCFNICIQIVAQDLRAGKEPINMGDGKDQGAEDTICEK